MAAYIIPYLLREDNHHNAFYSPFASNNVELSPASSVPRILAPPTPPAHDQANAEPERIRIYDRTTTLPIAGQGTIAVLAQNATELSIHVSAPDDLALHFDLSASSCVFSIGVEHEGFVSIVVDARVVSEDHGRNLTPPGVVSASVPRGLDACYLRADVSETYWLSIDRKNGILRYGKGYTNAAMTLFEVRLKQLLIGGNKDGTMAWKDERLAFLEKVEVVAVDQTGGDEDKIKLIAEPLPVVVDLPPYIATNATLTLTDLANGTITVPENLPVECQKLYHNVAGPNILLDTPAFPQFSTAIERSVNTPGLLGHHLCKNKAGEFGHEDMSGTYLRITLGWDLGDSPGPPYVLEIWPAGHHSPIHDHGKSFAVIKVLHGSIHAFYYDSLELPPRQTGPGAELRQGDITWISPTNYQVHQLWNPSNDGSVCCTIQCYAYGKDDQGHYEWFNYLKDVDGDGKPDIKDRFEPNSDMSFLDFQRCIKQEWDARWHPGGVEWSRETGQWVMKLL